MKREVIKKDGMYSHVIEITPRKGRKEKESFIIPVIDARDNRKRANEMIKDDNIRKGSKYIRQTFSKGIGRSYN